MNWWMCLNGLRQNFLVFGKFYVNFNFFLKRKTLRPRIQPRKNSTFVANLGHCQIINLVPLPRDADPQTSRPTVSLPFVCQSSGLRMWMLQTTCHHKESCLNIKHHPQLDRRAKFLTFRSLNLGWPPSFCYLVTGSHSTRWFILPPLFPPQKNFLTVLSNKLEFFN